MSSHSSDSDEDGFAPVIPGLPVTPLPTTTTATTTVPAEAVQASTTVDEEPVHPAHSLKRPREEDRSDADLITRVDAPSPLTPKESAQQEVPSGTVAATEEEEEEESAKTAAAEAAWSRYVHLGLPSAALYYRSFLHTSEPTPLPTASEDALDSAHEASHRLPDAVPTVSTPTPVPQLIDDAASIQDGLGVLLCTVDALGVLRLWRKLPRGVFFWGELDRIFGPPRTLHARDEAQDHTTGPTADGGCRHYLRSCAEVQSLVCVRVVHAWETASATAVEVHVEMRLVNPYTLTVEGRYAFAFPAPLRNGQPCYTPQPSLLVHKYELYLAFFTALVPSSSATEAGAASPRPLAQGVVVVPCQASKPSHVAYTRQTHKDSIGGESTGSASLATLYIEPAPLSVARRVALCVQVSASSRLHKDQQALPCVLVGADGMVDYALLEQTPVDRHATEAVESSTVASEASRSLFVKNGIGLRVVGGLATCSPHTAEHRVLSQLICFKRRVHTDFFALLKLARTTPLSTPDTASTVGLAHPDELAAAVLPLGVRFAPNGSEFLVASARVSLRRSDEVAGLAVYSQPCLHWFDLASGKLRGCHVTPLTAGETLLTVVPVQCPGGTATASAAAAAVERWTAYMAPLAEGGRLGAGCQPCVDLYVLPSASAAVLGGFEYHILVPEVSVAELLPGLVLPSASASATHATTGSNGAVPGRLVRVYSAVLDPSSAPTGSGAGQGPLHIAPLAHAVGELETRVRCGALRPPSAVKGAGEDGYTAVLLADLASTGGICARGTAVVPLLLLASTVTPSQALKNFLAQSPVGASLSADELKHLLVTPSSHSDAAQPKQAGTVSAPPASTDALLCTTALGPSAASALLFYSATRAECDPTTAAAAQWLHKASAQAGGLPTMDAADSQSGDSGDSLVKGGMALLEQQRVWRTVMQALAQRRQFACGDLLAGATSTTRSDPAAESAAAATGETDAHDGTAGPSEMEAVGTAMGVVPPSAPAKPAAALDAKGKVLALLEPVLATLALPPPSASAYVPKEHGLVHVRGYGTLRLGFLPQIAPLAVENFQRLARQNYYNGLTFHRVIPLTIVQGGCPRGDGTGGACIFDGGDTFRDENLELFPFFSHTEHAWLCMANAGADTNGSQFFFTVPGGQAMPWLNGQHTVFGFVVGGASLLTTISEVPRDGDDKPRLPIVMERIDIY